MQRQPAHGVAVVVKVKERLKQLAKRNKQSLRAYASRVLIDHADRATTPNLSLYGSLRVTRPMGQPLMVTINLRLSEDAYAKLDSLAMAAGTSFGGYSADVLERHLSGRRR
jgi:hypothetical protein